MHVRRFAPVALVTTLIGVLASLPATHAIDKINRRWGLEAVHFGAMHGFCHAMEEKIAFGRIPDAAGRGS